MKLINKLSIGIIAATAIFAVGCANSAKTVSENSLGLRKTNLYVEDANTKGYGTDYTKPAPGKSKKIKRAFQDAPPMIPHDVTGMLPITKDNNQCITCHVDSAPYDKTIPSVPVSHFTSFRSNSSYAIAHANTSSEKLAHVNIKKLNHLYPGRFNCSQCHAPQANVKLLVENKFKPEYAAKDGAFKSSWDDTEFMRDIDTTK